MRLLLFFVLVITTWILNVYHLGTAPPLSLGPAPQNGKARWIPREQLGIHQLVLEGTPFERGFQAGKLTTSLLHRQEQSLQEELKNVLPSPLLQRLLFFFSMRWFWGIEHYLAPWMLEEMWGVSQSASHDFDFLADPYTRQIAYHGLHEVGQTMVDMNPERMGCTVLALPREHSWAIGRNFDFEGGEIFDTEKIMKWVFPSEGYPFLSIIWAGMVGAVTGVNSEGVYISVNAAGTKDFKRLGTPSTLVLLEALQFSKTAEEARDRIEKSQLFITDIFVVSQSHRRVLYRIEKSPLRHSTLTEEKPIAITNHLVSTLFQADPINSFRREQMTSLRRWERGQELVDAYRPTRSNVRDIDYLLEALRDKKGKGGTPLPLGNRMAIDSLIATHAVLFDGETDNLYVSQGPSLIHPFIGFDLKQSFSTKTPTVVSSLPGDPLVNQETWSRIMQERKTLRQAKILFKKKDWKLVKEWLDRAIHFYDGDSEAYKVLGDYYKEFHEASAMKEAYRQALKLEPPYRQEREFLESELKK